MLKEGVSILVFPEGTRSRDGKIKAFKSGAFKMARRGEAPVVPISLDGTSKVMPHGSGFLRFYPGVVNITIHEATQLTSEFHFHSLIFFYLLLSSSQFPV